MSSYQRPFHWQDCGYSTMSDGIFVLKVCEHNETAIELVAADFMIRRLQQHGHEFRDQTNLLEKETLENSAMFLFVFYLDSR